MRARVYGGGFRCVAAAGFRYRIVAAGMQRMATPQAARGQPCTTRRAVTGHGFHRVFRATGRKAATRPQQRTDEALVEAQGGDEQAIYHLSMIGQLLNAWLPLSAG